MSHCVQNVADFLLEGKDPGSEAILTVQRSYTYGELISASHRVSRSLLQRGIEPGDRILLVADNSFFWAAAYLGVLRIGSVCVPLPANSTGEYLRNIIQKTEPQLAFMQASVIAKHQQLLPDADLICDRKLPGRPGIASFDDMSDDSNGYNIPLAAKDSDLACLMFTSGSTGQPRGVMVSHRNIIANSTSIIEYLELTSRDRIMTVLPFYYCFGTSLLHTHLRVGGTLVLDHRFMFPEKILERMQETKCSGFAGVPSHYQVLLNKSTLRKKSFTNLRYVQQAGGHLPERSQRELSEALPSTKVFVMYGQTEATARLSYLPPELLQQKAGSIGKGIPGVKLSVVDEQGIPVAPGQVGEIIAEGDNITLGYWRDPEETNLSFRNGKLYTGDQATVDENGFIYVVGRAKDFLKCGGKRVSCKQIEEEISKFDDVAEVAVIGVADELLGEAVKAFVAPRSGIDFAESRLLEFCKEHLSFQLVPKEIVVLNALPRSESGKVLKEELRKYDCKTPAASERCGATREVSNA